MTARGASTLLFFARLHVVGSAVRGTCGCRSQKVVARAAPPAAPCGGRGLGWRAPPPALLDSPASPPPTAGRACAPPCGGRRLALAAAMIQWGAVPPPLVRCGGCPSLRRVRWCLPGVGVGAVVVAPPGAGPFRSASLKVPGAAPPPVPAPLRLRARGGGSAGCGQRGRPPALAGELTMK